MPSAADFEKLGVFYLGRPYDWQQKKAQDGLILYDSKDLVTHAVCVGMTGSGKTGLCLALLEEAAIDGIPAIVIDPKGDLANLLLTFPELKPEDFRPWVNEDDARKQEPLGGRLRAPAGGAVEEGARGLGPGRRPHPAPARRGRLRGLHARAATPAFRCRSSSPSRRRRRRFAEDEELLRERVGTTATSLLGLLGIEADPIKSREHILLSTILDAAWRQGQELDLAGPHPADPDAAGDSASASSTWKRSSPPRSGSPWR